MSNLLAGLIDRLPPPQISDSVSEADRELILLLVESAKQQVRPYTGDYTAAWLLVSFDAELWETTNRGREEFNDGDWKNTVRIDWRVPLPNGALLTDARYCKLLEVAKKVSFLIRSNLIAGTSAPSSWKHQVGSLLTIVQWVVLHEARFQPETHGLSLIDQPSLVWYFGERTQGGLMQVMQIPQRSLAAFYRGAHGKDCPAALLDNPFRIPASEIHPIVRWIETQDGFMRSEKGVHKDKRLVSRAWLGRLIGESSKSLKGCRSFLRQLEPDFANMSILVSTQQLTEYPPQRTKLMEQKDEGGTEATLQTLACAFATILDAHRHLPDLLPDPANLSLARAKRLAEKFVRPSSHTPFMPVNTGLAYLNAAMRFVHLYGEAIIGLYLAVLPNYRDNNDTNKRMNVHFRRHAKHWRIASGELLIEKLNITEFRRQESSRDFNRFRSNPTLDDALRVLIGSCIVCMALLKPSREEELTHLKRNCLRQDDNGYWMNFDLGKSNPKGVEAWQEEDRPIPVISAKAIQLMQKLGEGLVAIRGEDRKASGNLFYLPATNGCSALGANSDLLNMHLDLFCDFVGLPPDSEGRRWYVRIHEMRKWFLLLLFWSGRFDVLDAARWIAGHTDASHIYAYIEREFPGEELPQIEAQYSQDRLRKIESGDINNADGANALYERVLRHFNVESLSMIPETEWAGFVRTLREADEFHLEPHSIRDEDGSVVGLNVSFVMRERQ